MTNGPKQYDSDKKKLAPTRIRPSDEQPDQSPPESEPALPARIGRYKVDRVLGRGGFGQVVLAIDTELERNVAIKLPHQHRLVAAEDVEKFLKEARTVASLDHAGVVPIYDVDRCDDLCYVVSKYIEGETLMERMRRDDLTVEEIVRLVMRIAETLDFIHLSGVVHRDIKPGNLLLDTGGECYVTDFGLALRDFEHGQTAGQMGTISYMSPEQARGESHLVDGRSDLFSLGVVMYEMLTGERPFVGSHWQAIIFMICYHDPRPPRHLRGSIPRELERICLKLLAKRASDRYLTGNDLNEDLRHFRTHAPSESLSVSVPAADQVTRSTGVPSSDAATGMVPRGLRSFDQEDAVFFRALLPGPRDRSGIPDSLTFWKRRIEGNAHQECFRIGVIYGPSGSGKSSFVKAGLIPLLDTQLDVVFLEATGTKTEQTLLRRLRRRCPSLPEDKNLAESLAWIRRNSGADMRRKVVIVLDQFEQWLHQWDGSTNAQLVVGLRQCDGNHLQCIALIRDDFWLAASRFADAMDEDLVRGRNLAMVDLFDKPHARKVFLEFGRGYGRLGTEAGSLTKSQNAFLDETIDGLAEDDRVIPVRLAAFAEIMKGRAWDQQSLRELGGVEGVGVRFLEESFSNANAPAQNRSFEKAAQAVLKSLLPDAGTNIKGAMRSEAELRTISGCESHDRHFRRLIQILDADLRLITPTDAAEDRDESHPDHAVCYYQLTHDFLVPAVRTWLERRQQLTMRGRTAMRLADRTEVWTARPDKRHLPSWLEWASFLVFTRSSERSESQRRLMAAASRHNGTITLVTLAVLVVMGLSAVRWRTWSRAVALSEQLATAGDREVSGIISQLVTLPDGPRRLEDLAKREQSPLVALRAKIGLLHVDPANSSLFSELENEAFVVGYGLLPVISSELGRSPELSQLVERLWAVAGDADVQATRRFRAALMLASYDPGKTAPSRDRWSAHAPFFAEQLILHCRTSPDHYNTICDLMRPARSQLVPHLRQIMRSTQAEAALTQSASAVVITLTDDDFMSLADILLDASDDQLELFLPFVDEAPETITALFRKAAETSPASDLSADERGRVANRQANAAALLLRHGVIGNTWDLLRDSAIPNTRTGIIERAVLLGADPELFLSSLPAQRDAGVMSAMLLTLGTYDPRFLSAEHQQRCVAVGKNLFETHNAAIVHSAAEWLLRRHGEDEWITQTLASLAGKERQPDFEWLVNEQEQTLLTVQQDGISVHMAATEVTVEQYLRFRPNHRFRADRVSDQSAPAIQVSWYDAVDYCNWLTIAEGMGEDEHCYVSDGEDLVLAADYRKRRGYRLPTTQEWEAACFGQSITQLPIGDSADRLPDYGWTLRTDLRAVQSVGLLKPGPAGFFGMLGNVSEWASAARSSRAPTRPLRGPRYSAALEDVLKILREGNILPETRYFSIGFRHCRRADP